MTNWTEIEVPRGAFIGWGTKPGQHVTGKVLFYDGAGGTDYKNNPCPTIEIELTENADSFNKEGDRTQYDRGDTVILNAGQVSLKRALRAAKPVADDLVRITLSNLVKTANGTVKEFSIAVSRNAQAAAADDSDDDQPPF